MILRAYQLNAIQRVRQSIRAGNRRILLVAPTGAGKTVIASHILDNARQKLRSGLFVAHRREIIFQTSEKLQLFGCDHGLLLAGHRRSAINLVTVASVQTFCARCVNGKTPAPEADLVVFDEAHRSIAPSYTKLLAQYPNAILLGLTATPVRSDGRGLGALYEDLVEVSTVAKLTAEGYLVPTIVYAPVVPDLSGVRVRAGDYVGDEIQAIMDKQELVGNVVRDWQARAATRKTLVFASGVAHSMHLAEAFREAGVNAAHIDGGTEHEDRRQIMRALEHGDLQVLCNCDVATEGFDCPPVSCIVLARPTKSYGLYLQIVGRGLRPYDGKEDCIVIDHAGAVYQHGFVTEAGDWSLDPDETVQERREKKAAENKAQDKLIHCRECGRNYSLEKDGVHCPSCGAKPTQQAKELNMREGRLRRVKTPAKPKKDEKERFWTSCLYQCAHTGRPCGAAAHMYRNKFGIWPRGFEWMPTGEQWRLSAREFLNSLNRERAA